MINLEVETVPQLLVILYVIVTPPPVALLAVTSPVLLTDALEGLLLIQVPPGVAFDNCIELPTHTDVGPVIEDTVGVVGAELITTFADEPDVQDPDVTVKVYVTPACKLFTIVLLPLPFVVTPPGLRVKVHEPAGNPLKATLPVGITQVG